MTSARKRQRTNESGNAVPTAADSHDVENLPHSKSETQLRDPRTLFVRLLAPSTSSEDLVTHFSQSYPIKHAVAVLDSDSKLCKGFGFVTFADQIDANAALKQFDSSEINGRKIKVELAQVRHRGEDDHTGVPRASKPAPEKTPPPKIIVRNLPWTIDDPTKLTHLFLSFGKVKEAFLPKTSNGRLRGFGIVLLRGRKNAEKAIQSLNGKEIEGRTLAVDWAADKETWEKVKQDAAEEDEQMQDLVDGIKDDGVVELADANDMIDDDHENDTDLDDHSEEDVVDEDGDEDQWSSVDDDSSHLRPDEETEKPKGPDRTDETIFIRNLPFTCTDEDLTEHFEQFGRVRYSRVVYDAETERPRGIGFVCFIRKEDADTCVKEAPRSKINTKNDGHAQSVLQDYSNDPSGKYTIEGRVLIISRAVKKEEADKLRQDGINFRNLRDKDKRRLYLLNEGKIPSNSALYSKLPDSEIKMRDASAKQRKTLVESNPSLHLSLTRLAIRNIPKFMTSKDLKSLAREAVVGFATDVKNDIRERLSKEELARGGDEMKEAERLRKVKGKGVVKQAKIVFESEKGSKIPEADGAGRSRGYGFIEYYTHRSALMGLRWLNGHEIDPRVAKKGEKKTKVDSEDRKKRLIVEFALENVNVVARRQEREKKATSRDSYPITDRDRVDETRGDERATYKSGSIKKGQSEKQKFSKNDAGKNRPSGTGRAENTDGQKDGPKKLARRQQIIAKKRMARRARKKEAK
jgi:nucleolar protein 4